MFITSSHLDSINDVDSLPTGSDNAFCTSHGYDLSCYDKYFLHSIQFNHILIERVREMNLNKLASVFVFLFVLESFLNSQV